MNRGSSRYRTRYLTISNFCERHRPPTSSHKLICFVDDTALKFKAKPGLKPETKLNLARSQLLSLNVTNSKFIRFWLYENRLRDIFSLKVNSCPCNKNDCQCEVGIWHTDHLQYLNTQVIVLYGHGTGFSKLNMIISPTKG